jgi:Ca-activated chloride channel family protein
MFRAVGGAKAGRGICGTVLLLFILSAAAAAAGIPAAERESDGKSTAPMQRIDDAALERLLRLHYTESQGVRLVLLPTSVTDRKGRVVRGLERNDFRLYDNQELQEIKYFSAEAREPISIAFLLDVSGSMRRLDKLVHAKEAIRYFVDRLTPEDRFGLICFADEQVAWVTEFTNDHARFLRRLEVQEGFGQTALNDAVAAAPGLVHEQVPGRKALLLITDGIDNSSRLSTDQAVGLARKVSVPIYTIGFVSVPPSFLPKGAATKRLEMLTKASEETGGRLFPVYDPSELKEAVRFIDNELRFQYVIGYYPTNDELDGSFRQIRLLPNKRRWQVRTRSGYYATP